MPSIISINVNGLNDKAKAETIFHNLNNNRPDIVLMQETHLNNNTKSLIISDNRWKGTKQKFTQFTPTILQVLAL